MIAWAVRQLMIWGGVGMLLYAFVGHRLAPTQTTVSSATTTTSASAAPSGAARGGAPNSVNYRAGRDGHVRLDAAVNGATVRFMVDTGASAVVLTLRDAEAAGISRSSLAFNVRTSTANGIGHAAQVTLREVRIGQLAINNVRAMVVENLSTSLLGQTFLTRVDSYEMRDGVLTLNYW